MGLSLVKGYYYLVPLWCVVEVLFWPGLRAAPVAGDSLARIGIFYTLEGGIAAAFWLRFWAAEHIALFENSVYLASILAALAFDPRPLSASAPGIVFAVFQAATGGYRLVYLRRHRPRPGHKVPRPMRDP